MIENEWLPNCMACGISYNDFWHMNPRKVKLFMQGYQKQIERQRDYDNYIAYINGAYVRDALMSTVGNMFKKKSAKPMEYPSKPYELGEPTHREFTEDEIEAGRLQFLANLKMMQANFERSRKDGEVS